MMKVIQLIAFLFAAGGTEIYRFSVYTEYSFLQVEYKLKYLVMTHTESFARQRRLGRLSIAYTLLQLFVLASQVIY